MGVRTILGNRTFLEASGKLINQYQRYFFNSPESGPRAGKDTTVDERRRAVGCYADFRSVGGLAAASGLLRAWSV
jgi:hypothetical protein